MSLGGFPIEDFRNGEKGDIIPEWFCHPFIVTPECLYCPLSVTPECFYQGSTEYLKAFGFPIKDFRNDGGASLLNGSTRSLYYYLAKFQA